MTISAHILAAKPEEAQVPSVRSACGALTFEEVYAQGFRHVVRWIRALGGRDADLEDLAQETFVIVRRQLPTFCGGTGRRGVLGHGSAARSQKSPTTAVRNGSR